MEKLDEIVVGEVARQVLDPDRLTAMLAAYVQSAAAQADGAEAQLAKLRHDHTAAVAGIVRLLELVEKGLMEPQDPAMRERLVALKLQRDQVAKEIGELQNRLASPTPRITPEKVARIGGCCVTNSMKGPRSSGRPTPACSWTKSRCHRRGDPHQRVKIRSGEVRSRRGRRSGAQSSLFYSGVARPMRFELLASELLIRLCSISRCSLRARARQLDRKKRPNRPSSDASSQRGRLADRQPPPCPRSRVQAPFPPHLGDSLCIRSPNLERLSGSHAGLPQHPFGELPL
jgi:hypothetical protein